MSHASCSVADLNSMYIVTLTYLDVLNSPIHGFPSICLFVTLVP